jgi:hypothetical protein
MSIDITSNPFVFCAVAAMAYPLGLLIGAALDKLIRAIWPPRPMPGATRRFHIWKP